MDWNSIITGIIAFLSAVIVGVLSNWDKLNKNKQYLKDTLNVVQKLKNLVQDNQHDVKELSKQMQRLSAAQRVALQTTILADCRCIQLAITKGSKYDEQLKQLIILYREYYLCGYNSQAKVYFNDTIERASGDNNLLVRELMNTYFSDYTP